MGETLVYPPLIDAGGDGQHEQERLLHCRLFFCDALFVGIRSAFLAQVHGKNAPTDDG